MAASALCGSSRAGRELVVLGDLQPHAQRQPDVVERGDPGAGIVLVQPDLATAARQRIEQRHRRGVLLGDQVGLVQHPQPGGQFGVLGVEIGQQPGDGRIGRAGSTGRRSSR